MSKKAPPKKKRAVKNPTRKTVRARKVAQAVMDGKSQTATAQELGVSRKTVQRDLGSGGVQAVIIGLVNDHYGLIGDQFVLAMESIGQAFYARNFQLVRLKVQVLNDETGEVIEKDSYEIVDLGPDHYARLAAVKRHLEIVTAGRQSVKPEEKQQNARLLTISALQDLAREENRS